MPGGGHAKWSPVPRKETETEVAMDTEASTTLQPAPLPVASDTAVAFLCDSRLEVCLTACLPTRPPACLSD